MTNYEFHPWEIWNGGECPCPDELVQVHLHFQTRSEAENNHIELGRVWGWSDGAGIIAFRRVKKPVSVRINGLDTHRLIFDVVNGEPVNPRFEKL